MHIENALKVLLNLCVVVSDHLGELLNRLLILTTLHVDAHLPGPPLNPKIERVLAVSLQVGAGLVVCFLGQE